MAENHNKRLASRGSLILSASVKGAATVNGEKMQKITPEMLGSEVKAIEVPEYNWKKQSRTDAWGTTNWTNSSRWTSNPPPFGQTLDTTNDSITD